MKSLRLMLATCLLALTACSEPEPLYGAPTPLLDTSTPQTTLCAIRDGFTRLPKPLMTRISYQESWTEYPLFAARVTHRGFHRIHLSNAGLDFLESHARLELVASLSPLFNLKPYGGEAAVLLAGIPAGRDGLQGMHTRGLASRINLTGYQSPESPGIWYQKAEYESPGVTALYGMTNSTMAIHRRDVPDLDSTLEGNIIAFLKDLSSVPVNPLAEGHLHMPQPHNPETIMAWIEARDVPELATRSQAFIDEYRGAYAATLLWPLVRDSGPVEGYERYLMWLLSLQDEHWPAMLSVTSSGRILSERREQFRVAARERILGLCDSQD